MHAAARRSEMAMVCQMRPTNGYQPQGTAVVDPKARLMYLCEAMPEGGIDGMNKMHM